EWHQNLIESAAEASEELMEKYLGGEELTEEEIKQALRQRVLKNYRYNPQNYLTRLETKMAKLTLQEQLLQAGLVTSKKMAKV
ncbi:hypothetical protein MJN51_41125, partial [Salmonella enterica subsp. enterica serovar Kentucky]|nr:hypothetical protein [Salmonella enterica subsp. enterica serovar Kentucky]